MVATNPRPINRIVVHHSENINDTFESVHRWQTSHPDNPNRKSHIRYHFVIEKSGRIVAGPPESQMSMGTTGFSKNSVEVCLCGHFDKEVPTPEAIERLTSLLVNWCKTYRLSPGPSTIVGHNEVQPTKKNGTVANLCPGVNLKQRLPGIRLVVAQRLAARS